MLVWAIWVNKIIGAHCCLGSRMVQHLWKKGNHDLFLFDLSDETVNKLVKDSNGKAQRCSTVEQVAKEASMKHKK